MHGVSLLPSFPFSSRTNHPLAANMGIPPTKKALSERFAKIKKEYAKTAAGATTAPSTPKPSATKAPKAPRKSTSSVKRDPKRKRIDEDEEDSDDGRTVPAYETRDLNASTTGFLGAPAAAPVTPSPRRSAFVTATTLVKDEEDDEDMGLQYDPEDSDSAEYKEIA